MSADFSEELKEIFFEFEDALMENAVLAGLAPDSLSGIALNPSFYDSDGSQHLKCIIQLELPADASIDEEAIETVSDVISDYLRDECELFAKLSGIGVDPELLDWWPVEIVAV